MHNELLCHYYCELRGLFQQPRIPPARSARCRRRQHSALTTVSSVSFRTCYRTTGQRPLLIILLLVSDYKTGPQNGILGEAFIHPHPQVPLFLPASFIQHLQTVGKALRVVVGGGRSGVVGGCSACLGWLNKRRLRRQNGSVSGSEGPHGSLT